MPSLEFRVFAWVDVVTLIAFGIPLVFGTARRAFELFYKGSPGQKFLRNSLIDRIVLSFSACLFFNFDVINGFRTRVQCPNSPAYVSQTEHLIVDMFEFMTEVRRKRNYCFCSPLLFNGSLHLFSLNYPNSTKRNMTKTAGQTSALCYKCCAGTGLRNGTRMATFPHILPTSKRKKILRSLLMHLLQRRTIRIIYISVWSWKLLPAVHYYSLVEVWPMWTCGIGIQGGVRKTPGKNAYFAKNTRALLNIGQPQTVFPCKKVICFLGEKR